MTLVCGLSDFHKMTLNVLKSKSEKQIRRNTVYRNYKEFEKGSNITQHKQLLIF